MRVDAFSSEDLLAVAWITEVAKEDRNNERSGRPKGHLETTCAKKGPPLTYSHSAHFVWDVLIEVALVIVFGLDPRASRLCSRQTLWSCMAAPA